MIATTQANTSDDLLKQTLAQAWQHVLQHENAAAMQFARTAATIAPDSPDVAHLLGILASRDGRSDIALPLLQKALDAGLSERRLRDMTEALMIASQPQAALAPITDAIKHYGENSANLGMLAAVQIALEDFDAGAASARKAIQLANGKVLWEGSLAFCDLILQKFDTGLKALTARPSSLVNQARCPFFYGATPTDLWLKNEQGPGDTVFFLCHAKKLQALGWRLHVQSHIATLDLLKNSGLFASVSLSFDCPADGLWIAIGDLPLAAVQLGLPPVAPPLQLQPKPKLQTKLKKLLAKFGPAPYIAVTWRGGVQGNKQRSGVRMGDRYIDTAQLGTMLSQIDATIISIQRVPDKKEENAFKKALGRDFLDLSRLNNHLDEMLALLSLVDEYIAVPNTNHHLREALSLTTHAIVNRPFEDWRWVDTGNSPWYPQAMVYRQALNGDLTAVFADIQKALCKKYPLISSQSAAPKTTHAPLPNAAPAVVVDINTLSEGWQALSNNNVALAIKTAQNALAISPDNPDALHLLGWAAMRDLKIEIAVSVLARAVEHAPLEGRIIGDYIRALSAAKQFNTALEVATEAINNPLTTNKSGLYYGRATVYMQLNRLHECCADYDSSMKLAPNRLDAPEYAGLVRLKIGDARLGFKNLTARRVARRDELLNDWCCPRLKPEHKGTRVLIKRDMGLGDELTYLRYLPWLTDAGMVVDYWAGKKLAPILQRMGYYHAVHSDANAAPNREDYDLSLIVNDLPVAVELLDAPAIAPPLPLTPRPDYVEKWQAWLAACGEGPYIGFNWRAGAAAAGAAEIHSKLAKAIDGKAFSTALSPIKATWISLQRNVMLHDIQAFEQQLGAPIHDAAAMTDDLEDLLALLYLLDENIGVSNTNMHLRASLGKGSKVMVQSPGGDWRWGYEGNQSLWFTESKVYRQNIEGDWQPALDALTQELSNTYALKSEKISATKPVSPTPAASQTKRIIWLTAGVIKQQDGEKTSDLASARYRVLAPAAALESMGWQSEFVNEQNATLVGGWGSAVPKAGDTVIISKVFTDFAMTLAKDAKARGASVMVDFCDNFLSHPTRGQLQTRLIDVADKITVADQPLRIAFKSITEKVVIEIASLTDTTQETTVANAWVSAVKVNPNPLANTLHAQSHENTSIAPRVLIGILYSGEQDYAQCIAAMKAQTYSNYDYFVIENLPNKLAHDTLYSEFMAKAGACDYFLKLDADMVFQSDSTLHEMILSCTKNQLAHLFAYVYDCPSGIAIPGIQMFASNTKWLGSDEQLNVDYPPQILGKSQQFVNKSWIHHMPNPSDYQLFRYGIHKALKSLQPDRQKKNTKKGILHLSILNGIARNVFAGKNDKLWLALIGATLVYDKQYVEHQYNTEQTKALFDEILNSQNLYEQHKKLAKAFWINEIQTTYWWLDNFNTFKSE